MKSARVQGSAFADAHESLAQERRQLPTCGVISAGIKILTESAAAIPKLVEIYNRGVAAGKSFDEIIAVMKRVKGCPRMPLRPLNVPYFRAIQQNFDQPGAVDYLMENYGSIRDEEVGLQLYDFPVIFPVDDPELVFTETFVSYGQGLERWSAPDPETGDLACMKFTEIGNSTQNTRGGKRWGGRSVEIDRQCNPNDCDRFSTGRCKHNATLYFWIPGLLGASTIRMSFSSVYSSMDIMEQFNMVTSALGHIDNLHMGKPFFRISKTLDRVSRIDWETGETSRSPQWIIRLGVDLDMMQVASDLPRLEGPTQNVALQAPPVEKDITPEPKHDQEMLAEAKLKAEQALQEQHHATMKQEIPVEEVRAKLKQREQELAAKQEETRRASESFDKLAENHSTTKGETASKAAGAAQGEASQKKAPTDTKKPAASLKSLRRDVDDLRKDLGWDLGVFEIFAVEHGLGLNKLKSKANLKAMLDAMRQIKGIDNLRKNLDWPMADFKSFVEAQQLTIKDLNSEENIKKVFEAMEQLHQHELESLSHTSEVVKEAEETKETVAREEPAPTVAAAPSDNGQQLVDPQDPGFSGEAGETHIGKPNSEEGFPF